MFGTVESESVHLFRGFRRDRGDEDVRLDLGQLNLGQSEAAPSEAVPMEGVVQGTETPKVRSKRSRSGSANSDLREIMTMMREMQSEIRQLKEQRSTTGQPN